jgi:hypothetical protein
VYANDGKWYYIAGATTAPTAAPTTPPTDISSVLFVGISGGMITGTDI